MPVTRHNPAGLFPQYRCYSHATEIRGDARLLMISGLNGYLADGKTMPESFEAQAEIVWAHIRTLLGSAGMDLHNLVFVRTYLADPQDDEANVLPPARSEVETRSRGDRRDVAPLLQRAVLAQNLERAFDGASCRQPQRTAWRNRA